VFIPAKPEGSPHAQIEIQAMESHPKMGILQEVVRLHLYTMKTFWVYTQNNSAAIPSPRNFPWGVRRRLC
jgi:hypothetical protein